MRLTSVPRGTAVICPWNYVSLPLATVRYSKEKLDYGIILRELRLLCSYLMLNFIGHPKTWSYFVNQLLGKSTLITMESRRFSNILK